MMPTSRTEYYVNRGTRCWSGPFDSMKAAGEQIAAAQIKYPNYDFSIHKSKLTDHRNDLGHFQAIRTQLPLDKS